jgi:hypothetical protein
MLEKADSAERQQVYRAAGVHLRYQRSEEGERITASLRVGLFRVGGGIRINTVGLFDASRAWGSSHVGARIDGNPVREVGTTELWLPAA